ncbi:MAG: polysaccharide deacetylase family protein [Spirochaetia bacterium]
MNRRATIVTYHFVRDLAISKYPEIKARTVREFQGQLDHIETAYTVITMEELVSTIEDPGCELPENALLLTFDDGYLDHYESVFPLLSERGMQGSFFPPALPVEEHVVLDVNKIHFILAAVKDKTEIVRTLFGMLSDYASSEALNTDQEYYEQLAVPSRYDTAEVVFIKRMLQKELPELVRQDIVNRLFVEFVTRDEPSFSRGLYMQTDHMIEMREAGMFFGAHGHSHRWLNTLSPDSQQEEIDRSVKLLEKIGAETDRWVMCYPHGAYDQSLLSLLRRAQCAAGLTIDVGIADLDSNDSLRLPRIDTNDLPLAAAQHDRAEKRP